MNTSGEQRLHGRVAIVTGGGRGLGREHVLALAEAGAAVVVNDLGSARDGSGSNGASAEAVALEVERAGGRAVASGHDVSDWDQAAALVELAIASFGDLHAVVNNAGILRDRTLARMTEAEWDDVIRVHLRGHAAPTRHAMAYWSARAAEGDNQDRSLIHTSSASGLAGNFGQANYAAAKLGILGLSRVAALEGERCGVRSNVVAPAARTRLSLETPGMEYIAAAGDPYDRWDPANVSPLIVWLSGASCPATSQIYHILGGEILTLSMPQIVGRSGRAGRWAPEELERELPELLCEHPVFADYGFVADSRSVEPEGDTFA